MTEVERIVSRAKRGRLIFGASIATLCLLVIAGVAFAIVVNFQQETKITQVQHSACEVDAAGKECQQTRRESSRAANIATTCIPFFKAGYPCPKPGSTAAERQGRRQEVQANAEEGRVAPAKGGSTGAPAPGATGNIGEVAPHTGGKPAGHAPPGPTEQPSGAQPSQPAPGPVATSPSTPQPEQVADEEPTSPAPEASSTPGLIGNPGGVVGGLCPTLNRLLPVCE